jgi:hypothetical protein
LAVQLIGTTPGVAIGKRAPDAPLKLDVRGPARFDGDLEVTGDVRLTGADCAEDFPVSSTASLEPGTVLVIDQDGTLKPSTAPYDTRVAGVIAGAGDCKPAIVLGRRASPPEGVPLSLAGKAYCKVDADLSPIGVGDLLTTSPTPGHAMKATAVHRVFGAVLGKALRPLERGKGLIPILIALQ